MSTHEQQTSTIPTSVVRNTGGKSGPQNLEEPASNEALRELCDKNYHQLLPLIAEKMQKEKEQQDKLKAVKARLLYGNESGRNPRNHEESHYSKSKTPTARIEPRRRHGHKHSQSSSPVASVFRRLKQTRPPSPRLWPRKDRGVFNRLGRKEPGASTRSDSHHQSSQAKGTEVTAGKHHHEGTSSRRTSGYSEAKTAKGVTGSPNKKGIGQIPTKMISPSLGRVKKETLSRPGSDILTSQGQGCLAMSRLTTEVGIRKTI
ncbi:hypothetical protein Tco_0032627 [Tanacetum coccineum]